MPHPTSLTPEVQQKIVQAILAGNYIETATSYAGISDVTHYNWINRGKAETARRNTGEPDNPQEDIYLNYLNAVTQARNQAEVSVVAVLRQHMPDTWQAAAWWLERSFPKRWGRKMIEVSGPDGGAIPIEVATSARQRVEERLARLVATDEETGLTMIELPGGDDGD